MALTFPWATKEYLLWEMSIGQILYYNNTAIEIQNGKQRGDLSPKSIAELKEIRDRMKAEERTVAAEAERQASEERKAPYRAKYGAI